MQLTATGGGPPPPVGPGDRTEGSVAAAGPAGTGVNRPAPAGTPTAVRRREGAARRRVAARRREVPALGLVRREAGCRQTRPEVPAGPVPRRSVASLMAAPPMVARPMVAPLMVVARPAVARRRRLVVRHPNVAGIRAVSGRRVDSARHPR
ncbi:hypothetical protein FAIPA1_290067 [Frankia sp. AiPs1]